MHLDVVGFKKKRAEEREKGNQKATEKKLWGLCLERFFEDLTKLKKLRVPELNKYLKHHRLEKHLTRHWLLQMNPEGTDLLQTRLRETENEAENEPLSDSDNNDSDEDDNSGSESSSDEENENDCIDSGDKDESSDVILAFIDDKEEVERPATTRSGRAITRRSEVDFFLFSIFFNEFRASLYISFLLTL